MAPGIKKLMKAHEAIHLIRSGKGKMCYIDPHGAYYYAVKNNNGHEIVRWNKNLGPSYFKTNPNHVESVVLKEKIAPDVLYGERWIVI